MALLRRTDYYEANINSGLTDETACDEKLPLRVIAKTDIQTCIDRLKEYFNGSPVQTETSDLKEDVIQDELNKANGNLSLQKHLQQQASLIRNLRDARLVGSDTIFIEFGAGRGMLSHWIQKAAKDESNVDFLLVDRASARYKADSYHRGADQGPTFNRIQIDIEHLNLSKVPLISSSNKGITGVSKHLCGAATDLALRCLLDTTHGNKTTMTAGSTAVNDEICDNNRASKRIKLDTDRVRGLLFALCCHHRCSWASYVGREFLNSLGFTPYYFHILCCLTSWATCGSRNGFSRKDKPISEERAAQTPEENTGEIGQESQAEANTEYNFEASEESGEHCDTAHEGSCIKALGLSKSESEEIGRQSKRLLDAGRVWYLNEHGFDASLLYYVDRSVSLENVALLARSTSHETPLQNTG